MYLDGVKL